MVAATCAFGSHDCLVEQDLGGDDFDFSGVSDADYAAVFGDEFGFGYYAFGGNARAIFYCGFGAGGQVVDFS